MKDSERQSKGVYLFSVCKHPCHDILHRKENWSYTKHGPDPVWDAGNTDEIESRLRFGYALLEKHEGGKSLSTLIAKSCAREFGE